MNGFHRTSQRIESHIVLSYKSVDEEKFNSSQLLDISRQGMQFTTGKNYPEQTSMTIHVLVPTSYPDKLQISGIVTHCHEKLKDMLYNTGIEYQSNTAETIAAINDYLDYLGADKQEESAANAYSPESSEADKRRYKRLKSHVIVQFIELGGNTISTSQIVDISDGGLLFNSEKFIQPGTLVRLKMTVPTSFPHTIKLEGTVRHCKEIMQNSLYQAGIEYSQEFPGPLEEIRKYVAYLLQKEEGQTQA